MSGPELIAWLKDECQAKKIPPTDSALILILRDVWDIDAFVKTLKHVKERK